MRRASFDASSPLRWFLARYATLSITSGKNDTLFPISDDEIGIVRAYFVRHDSERARTVEAAINRARAHAAYIASGFTVDAHDK